MTSSTEVPPVTGPDEPGHGHRITWKPVLIAALVTLAALGTALGLYFGLSGSGRSAAGLLQRDGYTVTQTVSHRQIEQQATNSYDQSVAAWFDNGAVGVKGNYTEAVIRLTPEGQQMLSNPLMQAMLTGNVGEGDVGLKLHVDGAYLIVSGPTNEMAGGWGVPAAPAQLATPTPAQAGPGTLPTEPGGSSNPCNDYAGMTPQQAEAAGAPGDCIPGGGMGSPPAQKPQTGPVGIAYTITEQQGDGTSVTYKIQLQKVVDPAQLDQYIASDPQMGLKPGEHAAVLKFYFESVAGGSVSSGTLEGGLTAVDTTGQVHSIGSLVAASSDVYPGTQGNDLLPGEHDQGWGEVDLPAGVHLASVRYVPNYGLDTTSGSSTVTWTIAR